jgi:hypothetical protein
LKSDYQGINPLDAVRPYVCKNISFRKVIRFE